MRAGHLGGEMGSSQTVLPFKLAASDESLTAHGGLALLGEYLRAMSMRGLMNHELPGPGSAAGYDPSAHVLPLVLMLAGGGRTLEDLRVLRSDTGLRSLLQLNDLPSSDAAGDWLRRMGATTSDGLTALQRVNRGVFRRLLRRDERTGYTLDIDATQIVAEKREAHYTYKGEKGYMPMVGHIAELSLVAGREFREGNTAPAARNLEFMQACERKMPKEKRIAAVRADSAAYQAGIFNLCEEQSPWRYHAVASNRDNEDAAATMQWYSKRGDASENRIKELKIGFGMDYMPCGTFEANAAFFSIGVLTYNLYLGFRSDALGSGWKRSQVQTVRWQLFQTAGKVVRHGRQVFLKISATMLDIFTAIRERCARIMREGGVVPETS